MPNFMKIRPVEAELSHADGQTDSDKATVAVRAQEARCGALPNNSCLSGQRFALQRSHVI